MLAVQILCQCREDKENTGKHHEQSFLGNLLRNSHKMCLWFFSPHLSRQIYRFGSQLHREQNTQLSHPQFYHWMKSMEEAEQNNLTMFPLMFSAVLITFKIRTVTLKSEAEVVCSVRRRWKRRGYSFLSTLIRSSKNYLLKGQKTPIRFVSPVWFHWSSFSPVLSVFSLFFSSIFLVV